MDWPITDFFWDFGHLLNRSTSLDPSCKIETNVLPLQHTLFQFYMWELNFAQTIWDKIEVLLGMSWGNNLRTWGTLWEHDENMLETHWEQGVTSWPSFPMHASSGWGFGFEFSSIEKRVRSLFIHQFESYMTSHPLTGGLQCIGLSMTDLVQYE
jgi:hypothetical protein